MDWFKDFYEEDYFKYRYAPRLDEVPAEEVDFIADAGGLDFGAGEAPRVFDICCGVGRHARPLALRGCEVVGVDLSANNIDAARKLAAEQGVADRCRFVNGDIRTFDPPVGCDLAINIFTSFGYFASDDEDAVILDKAVASLRPGGRFILDIANREALIANHKPREKRGKRNNYVVDETSIDLATGRMNCRWTFVRDGRRSEHAMSIRLYALHELIGMAESRGLRFLEARGDFSGAAYTRDSPRCIFVAEKP